MKYFTLILLLFARLAHGAVLFDASDDIGSTGIALSNFITGSAGTIAVWFKPTSAATSSSNCDGAHKLFSDDNGYMHLGRRLNSSVSSYCLDNYDGTYDGLNAVESAGVASHVVWRHSGGVLEIFVNGVSAGTIASGDTQVISNLAYVCEGGICNGTIYSMEAFTVALSNAEIEIKGKSRRFGAGSTKPAASWYFSNCIDNASADGLVVPDRSGNGRNLTLDNGANNTGMTCKANDVLTRRIGVQ